MTMSGFALSTDRRRVFDAFVRGAGVAGGRARAGPLTVGGDAVVVHRRRGRLLRPDCSGGSGSLAWVVRSSYIMVGSPVVESVARRRATGE